MQTFVDHARIELAIELLVHEVGDGVQFRVDLGFTARVSTGDELAIYEGAIAEFGRARSVAKPLRSLQRGRAPAPGSP
jgi:hypothetical protein